MTVWAKLIQWLDADMAAAGLPSSANSICVAWIPFGLGLLGLNLIEPWKDIALLSGLSLAAIWLLLWGWRASVYLRSVKPHKALAAEREGLPEGIRSIIFGAKRKSYNDTKLIAIRNAAVIGGGCGALFSINSTFHYVSVNVEDRIGTWAIAFGIVSPFCFVYCVWQLLSSPKQDVQFIKRWTPGLQKAEAGDVGIRLPDPSDPYFNVATVRYLAHKLQTRRTR